MLLLDRPVAETTGLYGLVVAIILMFKLSRSVDPDMGTEKTSGYARKFV